MASSTFQSSSKEDRKGTSTMDTVKEAGAEALEKAEQAGAEAFGKVKEAGAQAVGKAKEAVGSVGDMAVETVSAVGKKADDLTAAAGHGIKEFGETVGRKAPHDGLTGQASQAVAETIKESGDYLEKHKLSGMAQDVEQIVKNHPIPALLICLGIGFCVGRVMKD